MKEMILGIAAVTIIILLAWILGKTFGKSRKVENQKKLIKTASESKLLVTCPLCGSFLQKGQDLFSRVYRPMNVPDQLCTISGCPHCYPRPEPGLQRKCPVCGKNVPEKDGYLTARLFNKTDGKKHVVVTGCTECSKHDRP
ncbi:MAG: hypothetical protein II547_06785 [Treponema sp.]|nr:hypothetical protein [Treponema sp.]